MRGSDASLEIVLNVDKPCASKVGKRLPGESEGVTEAQPERTLGYRRVGCGLQCSDGTGI